MKKIILIILFSCLSLITINSTIKAAGTTGSTTSTCAPPSFIPTGCDADHMEPDLNCVNERLLTPTSKCCINRCIGTTPVSNPKKFAQFAVLGTTFKIDTSTDGITKLANLIFTSILGAVSIYTVIRGIYVAGFKRTTATTPEDIAKLNQELTNLVIGFLICWTFIIVIQVVANLFGIGKLSTLELANQQGGDGNFVITIQ